MNECISILDSEFELLRVTSDLYDETEELLTQISMNQEFLCRITNLRESPQATIDLRRLIRHILSLGMSFAIRQVASGRIVSAIANIIFHHKVVSSYYDLIGQFKSPNMIKYKQLLDAMEDSFEMYKEWQVDSVLEVEYLGTLPEFRCRGLAVILAQHTINFGRLMSQGRLPPDIFNQLSKEMQVERPKVICSIATSATSINFAKRMGFTVAHIWKISELKSWAGYIVEPSVEEDDKFVEFHIVKY